jgi:hypothetical protein
MRELVPAIKRLWKGDCVLEGTYHTFPATPSSPKPLRGNGPSIWIAARDPNSHEFAESNVCYVQVTPLWQGDEEIGHMMDTFDAACAKFLEILHPQIMLLKHTYIASDQADAEKVVIGSPDDMAAEVGPLCTVGQMTKATALVAQSQAMGAKAITGGRPLEREGNYFPPTVIDCRDAPAAPCLSSEFFAPVLSVVGFETEAEAVSIANDTEFGLASGVFTKDLTRAHRVIRGLRAGIVWVNTYRAVSPIAPFGGRGLPGHGREGGQQAALDYTKVKAVWLRTSDDPIPDPFVMR